MPSNKLDIRQTPEGAAFYIDGSPLRCSYFRGNLLAEIP